MIDYGGSNLHSVVKALEFVADGKHEVYLARDARALDDADRVVFPGQGAIADCMARLGQRGFLEAVSQCATSRPFFGICLGLQSLLQFSAEDGGTPCLGHIEGEVVRFSTSPGPDSSGLPQKVPHMGWNKVRWTRDHPLIEGIASDSRFYFVHSYYVAPTDPQAAIGLTSHITEFTSAVATDQTHA